MDVLSPFISVLCHSDLLFHGESCPLIDVVHAGRARSSLLAWMRAPGIVPCIISFSMQLLVSSWCDNSIAILALTVSISSLFTLALLRTHSFSLLCTKAAESISALLSQRHQDVFLHSFAHCLRSPFLGSGMNVKNVHCSGHSPVSQIATIFCAFCSVLFLLLFWTVLQGPHQDLWLCDLLSDVWHEQPMNKVMEAITPNILVQFLSHIHHGTSLPFPPVCDLCDLSQIFASCRLDTS